MKLVIEPNGMKIVTESIQDVAYLKNMGYLEPDPNMHLKVCVHKSFNTDHPGTEGVEISVKWEDKLTGSEGSEDPEGFEYVQSLEGPYLRKKA